MLASLPDLSMSAASLPASAMHSFTVKASALLAACKAAEAFRKGASALRGFRSYGLDAESLFFSSTGDGFIVEGFSWKEAFAVWLPGKLSQSGGFSLPFALLFPFVKATKGKGDCTYSAGVLSASASGASLSIKAGPSLFDSEAAESQRLLKSCHYLPALLSTDLTEAQKGFPLLPFLTAASFCSTDTAKLVLCGAGLAAGAFYGTDGFSLRKAEASLPGLPRAAAGLPDNAWLPSWLASCVEALTKPSERADLLAFHWPERHECQAVRVWLPSGLCVAFRFSQSGSFPSCEQLIPSLPYSFVADRKAFLSMIEGLLQSLKAYDGQPLVDLRFDAPIGTVEAAVTLQRNKGSKTKPDLETVGSQEGFTSASFSGFHRDPAFDDGFFELPESQQEVAREKFKLESRLCCNAFFLQKALKSLSADRFCFQWKHGSSPFILSDHKDSQSLCLIMPVQKRR